MNVPVDRQRWYGFAQSFLLSRMVQHSERNSEHDLALAPVDDTASSGKAIASTPASETDLAADFEIIELSLGQSAQVTLTVARSRQDTRELNAEIQHLDRRRFTHASTDQNNL
jgi:hypothetical protein